MSRSNSREENSKSEELEQTDSADNSASTVSSVSSSSRSSDWSESESGDKDKSRSSVKSSGSGSGTSHDNHSGSGSGSDAAGTGLNIPPPPPPTVSGQRNDRSKKSSYKGKGKGKERRRAESSSDESSSSSEPTVKRKLNLGGQPSPSLTQTPHSLHRRASAGYDPSESLIIPVAQQLSAQDEQGLGRLATTSHPTGHRFSDSMKDGGLITVIGFFATSALYAITNFLDPAMNNGRATNKHPWNILGKPYDYFVRSNDGMPDGVKPLFVIGSGFLLMWVVATALVHLYNKVNCKPSKRSIQDKSQLTSLHEQPSPGCFSRIKSFLFCRRGGAHSSLEEGGYKPKLSNSALRFKALTQGSIVGGVLFTILLLYAFLSEADIQGTFNRVNPWSDEVISNNAGRNAAGFLTYLFAALLLGPLYVGLSRIYSECVHRGCVKVEEVDNGDLEDQFGPLDADDVKLDSLSLSSSSSG